MEEPLSSVSESRPGTAGRDLSASAPESVIATDDMESVRNSSANPTRPTTDPGGKGLSRSFPVARKINHNFQPPSARYPEVELPNKSLLKRAQTPPNPVQVRRPVSSSSSMSSRNQPRGPGGKQGEVEGRNGGKYLGELLAGRPHGSGQYWVPSGDGMRLQYEGEWHQGMREGVGTIYYWTGEAYHGDFVQNKRHGQGRMEYKCGDVYEGEFFRDHKRGMGTQYYANGDCFIGFWMNDRREGLGTQYWVSKGKKYDGEWVDDQPCTGSISAISTREEEELLEQRRAIAPISKKPPPPFTSHPLPKLKLRTPNQVVFSEAASMRRSRSDAGGKAGKSKRTAQAKSGTLDESTLQRLKHSFVALAGGDGPTSHIRPSKIGDVCVLAGMDPAGMEVLLLLRQLHEHTKRSAQLLYDDFLDVIINFRAS